ncbi:MAG: preprotein translocase subunit SecY [Lachnospirales bacterium]
MFNVFRNAWKVKDIRKKLIFILLILAVYRFGTHLALPGIHPETLDKMQSDPGFGTLVSLITGGGRASIFALGIGPYITSSIIMQLLTVALPPLERLKKEGEEGRKKINQYSRVLAVVLAVLQASGTVYTLRTAFTYPSLFIYVAAVVSMVTGTIVIMWLGELLTEKGIGNGSSFIIFANIISNLPMAVRSMIVIATGEAGVEAKGVAMVIGILVLFIALIFFVVLVQGGERRIPVQYSRRGQGKQQFAGQNQYIPLKVNIAGVMSIIFAVSLIQFPQVLSQLMPDNTTLQKINSVLDYNTFTGLPIYIVLIFCFTFFYTSFSINPIEMAENMKKNASFIPGIRPGKPTSDYIDQTINRLSWIGASTYSVIAAAPVILSWIFDVQIGFGGTTLLIVTGVVLELIKQLESNLLMRHYKGFLK